MRTTGRVGGRVLGRDAVCVLSPSWPTAASSLASVGRSRALTTTPSCSRIAPASSSGPSSAAFLLQPHASRLDGACRRLLATTSPAPVTSTSRKTNKKETAAEKKSTNTRAPAAGKANGLVYTTEAPFPIGPYSQAVVASGPFLFVSGCIGLTLDGKFAGTDVATQTEQVMRNMEAILKAGGSSFANVVKCTILLTDMRDFAAVNEVYAKHFPKNPPARSTFATNGLPKGALVEIECIASVTNKRGASKAKKSTRASKTKSEKEQAAQ